jgi:hypothetical protein
MRHGTLDYDPGFINVTGLPVVELEATSAAQSTTTASPPPKRNGATAPTTNTNNDNDNNNNSMWTRQQVGQQRRLMWKRRHARSVSEGIRREKLPQLSIVLEKAENAAASVAAHLATSATSPFFPSNRLDYASSTVTPSTTTNDALSSASAATEPAVGSPNNNNININGSSASSASSRGRRIAARTLTGLISALAEEVNDLDVTVHARDDTPFWNKQVDAVKIQFSRLSFKPLRMGGVLANNVNNNVNSNMEDVDDTIASTVDAPGSASSSSGSAALDETKILTNVFCADEAFRQMDADNSGTLDRDELAMALDLATSSSSLEDERRVIYELASDLLELYDFNGDGVVDRDEYQSMVEDMAALREAQEARQAEILARQEEELALLVSSSSSSSSSAGSSASSDAQTPSRTRPNIFGRAKNYIRHSIFRRGRAASSSTAQPKQAEQYQSQYSINGSRIGQEQSPAQEVTDEMVRQVAKTVGSITVSDLKLDLRRLVFGAVPVLKHVTPGGPLILEPFTVTVAGSFNRNDIIPCCWMPDYVDYWAWSFVVVYGAYETSKIWPFCLVAIGK